MFSSPGEKSLTLADIAIQLPGGKNYAGQEAGHEESQQHEP
jgi:hypothetical protein